MSGQVSTLLDYSQKLRARLKQDLDTALFIENECLHEHVSLSGAALMYISTVKLFSQICLQRVASCWDSNTIFVYLFENTLFELPNFKRVRD